MIELALCTQTLLDEIANPKMRQKNIAQTYRLAMKSSEETDWATVNAAIVRRWSRSGLEHIKEMAWSGKCFEMTKGDGSE